MALYRVLKSLAKGDTIIPAGMIDALAGISQESLDILVRRGKISRIAPPPLAELPGWKRRADRLKDIEVLDAEQFLEADEHLLASRLGVRPRTVRRYKQALLEFVSGG